MCPIYADKQQSRHQPLTQQDQQVLHQLEQQQSWDLAPNQTIQQRREAHRAMLIQQQAANQQLAARAQAQFFPAQAGQAAAGTPVQSLAPTDETAKQRREKQRHARSARRHTPAGDHISYAMREQLIEHHRRQDALGGEWEEKMREQAANPDALRGFLQPISKHLSSKDKGRISAGNQALIDAYLSKYPVQHEAALRVCVQQVLDIRLSLDMLREEYLGKHLHEVLAIQEKLFSMQALLQDPNNRKIIEDMLPTEQHALLYRHLDEAPALRTLLHAKLAGKGVQMDGSYEADRDYITRMRQQQGQQEDDLQAHIDRTEQLLGRILRGKMRAAHAQLRTQSLHTQQKPEIRALGLTAYVNEQQIRQLADARTAIAQSPAQYAAHKPLIDQVYQQLFRATDALGDMQHQLDSADLVVQQQGAASALGQMAAEQAAALRDQAAKLHRQMDTASSLLRFLLGEQRELTEDELQLAEQTHIYNEVQAIQEQQDEALWASNPDALIERVQDRLNRLQFGLSTPQAMHITIKDLFQQGSLHQFTPEAARSAASDLIDALQADPRYASSMQQFITSPDGHAINGMKSIRVATMLVEMTYPHSDMQMIRRTMEELMCAGRYRELLQKQNRTPTEQSELDTYTPARLQTLEATFQQGIADLKALHLQQLRLIGRKYGRYLSQLHPEDFLARCGKEYFDEIGLQQDVQEMLQTGSRYLDPQHNADDQEYVTRTEALSSAAMVLQGYMIADTSSDSTFTPSPDLLSVLSPDSELIQHTLQYERELHGPGFNSAEMKAYTEILRRRFTGEESYRLIGRFAPEGGQQV